MYNMHSFYPCIHLGKVALFQTTLHCAIDQAPLLTFLIHQRSAETDDITNYQVFSQVREDGVLYRKGHVVCYSSVLTVPHPQQREPHIHRPNHKGAVSQPLPNKNQVIPGENRTGQEHFAVKIETSEC